MGEMSEHEVVAALGPVDRLIVQEILRTDATPPEYKRALAFAKGPGNADAEAYAALNARMKRLVDLLTVVLENRPERPNPAAARAEAGNRAA